MSAKDSRHPWYLLDIALYLAGIGAITFFAVVAVDTIGWMTFIALALATYRLADIISTEKVTAVIRAPFAGHTTGFRGSVAQGIECSSCTGTWAAAVLLACVVLIPTYGLIPVYALALSGCERIISRVINVLEKQG